MRGSLASKPVGFHIRLFFSCYRQLICICYVLYVYLYAFDFSFVVRFSNESVYNKALFFILHLLQISNTTEKSPQPGPSSRPDVLPEVKYVRCRRCTQCVTNRRELYLHGMQQYFQTGGKALQENKRKIKCVQINI
jgi:hypothetical protein